MNKITNLQNKKVLLVGFAREGVSSYQFLRKHFPGCKVGIFDQKNLEDLGDKARILIAQNKNLRLFLGQKDFGKLKNIAGDFDTIIKSAGIPNKVLPTEIENKITTQTALFFDNFKGTSIGVTGTKGKSTTASLIYEILKLSGKKTKLLGNIGLPCLDFLDDSDQDTIAVIEISSHQLSTLKQSPHIAVLLNIYPEHLDYYRNISEYVVAKANIARYQAPSDYLVYNSDDELVKNIAVNSSAKKIPFNKLMTKEVLDWKTKLMGKGSLSNILAAKITAEILKINPQIIKQAVENFNPLPHRLELVGEYGGVIFYNDSLATIPEAAVNALQGLGDKVETLIAGGFDRGLDFTLFAKAILNSQVKNLVFFPTTGAKIWKEMIKIKLGAAKNFEVLFTDKMAEAVRFAYRHTRSGKICLLSNGSPSFGVFKDYADRGEQFKQCVKTYNSL